MAGTFSDGFPMDPTAAVLAATFLTQQEREEWLSWISTASPDDKAELVNTLHEIWRENQPANTTSEPTPPPQNVATQTQTPAPVQEVQTVTLPEANNVPTPPPAPTFVPAPIETTEPAPTPAPVSQLPPRPPAPTAFAEPPKLPEEPAYTFKQVVEQEDVDLPPVPAQQPKPEPKREEPRNLPPRRDDRRPAFRDEPRGDRRDVRRDERKPERNDDREDRRPPREEENRELARPINTSNFVDLSKLQTDKTRSVLDKFMKEFTQTRRNEEQALVSIKNAVLGVEEVVNYADLLAEKMLALNNSQVQASKVASKSRDELLNKIDDVEVRLDDLLSLIERSQEEIERLGRRQRSFEADVKDMLADMKEQLSGSTSDQLGDDDKWAILSRRIDRVEGVRNAATSVEKNDRPQLTERTQRPANSPNRAPRPAQRERVQDDEVHVPQMPSTQSPEASNFMPLKLGNKGKISE